MSMFSQIAHTGLTDDGGYIVIDFDTHMVGTIEAIRAARFPHPNLTVVRVDNPIRLTQRRPATQPAPRKPVTPKRRSMKFRLDFYFSRQAHDELLEKLTASNKLYLTQTIPIEGTKATWIKVSWNEE